MELLILHRYARPIDRGAALPLTDSLSEFLAFRFRGLLQPALPVDANYREPSGMPKCFVQSSIPPYARTRRHKLGILLLSA